VDGEQGDAIHLISQVSPYIPHPGGQTPGGQTPGIHILLPPFVPAIKGRVSTHWIEAPAAECEGGVGTNRVVQEAAIATSHAHAATATATATTTTTAANATAASEATLDTSPPSVWT